MNLSLPDGLSKLPPIRLISEDDSSHEIEDDLQTARPKFASDAQPKASSTPILEEQSDDPPEGNGPSFQSSATPKSLPIDIQTTSITSSKVKAPPPPLLLDTPASAMDQRAAPAIDTKSSNTSQDPTPVSGDVLLPLIIFSVVKANPPHLVSNLLFIQRFRNQAVGGEESYCLINMLAVAEFLENVDMASLGLGDSDKVMRCVVVHIVNFYLQ